MRLSIVLAVIATVAFAWAAQAKDYKVHGEDIANGKPYDGKVAVTITDGVVDAVWDVQGEHYTGSGIADGDVVAVYFKSGFDGMILLRRDKAGVYHGKWTAFGSGVTAKEDWSPIK